MTFPCTLKVSLSGGGSRGTATSSQQARPSLSSQHRSFSSDLRFSCWQRSSGSTAASGVGCSPSLWPAASLEPWSGSGRSSEVSRTSNGIPAPSAELRSRRPHMPGTAHPHAVAVPGSNETHSHRIRGWRSGLRLGSASCGARASRIPSRPRSLSSHGRPHSPSPPCRGLRRQRLWDQALRPARSARRRGRHWP